MKNIDILHIAIYSNILQYISTFFAFQVVRIQLPYSPKFSQHYIYFCEFHKNIPVRENIIVNMLFPYISTVMTYLVREKLNAKILF